MHLKIVREKKITMQDVWTYFVKLPQVLLLGLIDNSQDSGNGFAHHTSAGGEKSMSWNTAKDKHHTFKSQYAENMHMLQSRNSHYTVL